MSKVLTTDEAAAMMRVSTKTFYGWMRTGKVPAKKIGKEWRISEDALMAQLAGAGGETSEAATCEVREAA